MLRGSVGCDLDAVVHLTAEEKAHCLKMLGDAARGAAPFVAIDPLKRAAYDAALQADADRRDGAKGQAHLKAIQDEHSSNGPPDHGFDFNAKATCGIALGQGADGKVRCHGGP